MISVGGYVMFDCRGLDLSSAEEQSKPGIYAEATRALATNKPVSAINCNYGGAEFSPVPVACHMADTTIIASFGVLQVFITSADKCTVQNLVS